MTRRLTAATLPALLLAAVACSGGGPASVTRPSTTSTPFSSATTSIAPTSIAGTTVAPASSAFVPIPSYLNGSGPAQPAPDPGDCTTKASTVDIEGCYAAKIENLDAKINQIQLTRFQGANDTARVAILSDDSSWLAARTPVCNALPQTGGTIDRTNGAICQFNVTTARLAAVQNSAVAVKHLIGSDNPDPSSIAYYTSPGGSLLGMFHSQGDQTGGGIISWHVIGGYQGFIVNPAQFPFVDGSFVDHGVVQGSGVTGHKVATGESYSFSIDYSQLGHDPHASAKTGRFQYAPAGAVKADWQ
jgi:uncharacterized protein YecT (DUF1311 family)